MIRILLVDDHKIIRDGLKALLYGEADLKIIGECSDGDQVMDFVGSNEVDIILMDINMPVLHGIEATKLVCDAYPQVRVIALTMHNEDGYISKVLKAGASGYVLKNTGREGLINAIFKVHTQGNFFTEEVASIMMHKYMKKNMQGKPTNILVSVRDLTNREIEILRMIAGELTNNEIAKELFISPRTVDTHRRNLLQKLAVKNTAGLVKFAIQNGLSE
jgi:DNA-binding NarL/FixJ family response regulator